MNARSPRSEPMRRAPRIEPRRPGLSTKSAGPSRRTVAVLALVSATLLGCQQSNAYRAERAVQSLLWCYHANGEPDTPGALDEIVALSIDIDAKLELARAEIAKRAPHLSEYIDDRARVAGWFVRVALWCADCEEQRSDFVSREILEQRFAAIRQPFLAEQLESLPDKCEGAEIEAAPADWDSMDCIVALGGHTLNELAEGLRKAMRPDQRWVSRVRGPNLEWLGDSPPDS